MVLTLCQHGVSMVGWGIVGGLSDGGVMMLPWCGGGLMVGGIHDCCLIVVLCTNKHPVMVV